jgi:hypothetical protein
MMVRQIHREHPGATATATATAAATTVTCTGAGAGAGIIPEGISSRFEQSGSQLRGESSELRSPVSAFGCITLL